MNSQEKNNDVKHSDQHPTKDHKHSDKEGCKCNSDCGCCERRKKKEDEKSGGTAKVIVASAIALLLSVPGFAQSAVSPGQSFWADPFNHPMLPVYTIMGFVFVTIILLLVTMVYVVKVLKFLLEGNAKERAEKAGVKYEPAPSFFQKFWDDINAAVPVTKEQDIDLGHSYDGIRELDNHLPPWWKGLFIGCVIWGIGYMIVYHITGSFPLSIDEYQNELATAEESAKALKASMPAEAIDENTLLYTADPEFIAKGKIVFTSNNCGSCHRADGGGSTIGPNLTDEYWLHGGNIANIFSTINKGVVEKGMPAWGKVMSPVDVRNATFYIMSLQGSNPKDGKAPQGELHKPAEVVAPPDSTVAIAN